MKLSPNEKGAILSQVLKAEGLSASTLNRLLDVEKGIGREATDARARVSKFVGVFEATCRIAERLKRERRCDKALGSARRSLERLCATRPAIERFKHHAKSQQAYERTQAMILNRQKISVAEAVVVFTASNKSTEPARTLDEVSRYGLAFQSDFVKVSRKFCESLGFTVA